VLLRSCSRGKATRGGGPPSSPALPRLHQSPSASSAT
jgi:hypothetical protein